MNNINGSVFVMDMNRMFSEVALSFMDMNRVFSEVALSFSFKWSLGLQR